MKKIVVSLLISVLCFGCTASAEKFSSVVAASSVNDKYTFVKDEKCIMDGEPVMIQEYQDKEGNLYHYQDGKYVPIVDTNGNPVTIDSTK